jgi:hypothetical protein
MKTLDVKYRVRYYGDSKPTIFKEKVQVELDSTEEQIDDIVRWYYYHFIVTQNVGEIYPYEIL